jgi:hypothetical protein
MHGGLSEAYRAGLIEILRLCVGLPLVGKLPYEHGRQLRAFSSVG